MKDAKKKVAKKMKSKYDLVGELMAYEDGSGDDKRTSKLFSHLKKTGIGSKLQGHYSSRM